MQHCVTVSVTAADNGSGASRGRPARGRARSGDDRPARERDPTENGRAFRVASRSDRPGKKKPTWTKGSRSAGLAKTYSLARERRALRRRFLRRRARARFMGGSLGSKLTGDCRTVAGSARAGRKPGRNGCESVVRFHRRLRTRDHAAAGVDTARGSRGRVQMFGASVWPALLMPHRHHTWWATRHWRPPHVPGLKGDSDE